MVVIPLALLAAAGYMSYGIYLSRKIYRSLKIDAYKTAKDRKNWEKHQNLYINVCLLTAVTWPAWILFGLGVLTVKGIKWLVTHNQEIPAEVREKIEKLEKELGLEDKKPDELAEIEELVTNIVDKHKDEPRTKCPYCHDIYITSYDHHWACPYYVKKSEPLTFLSEGRKTTVYQNTSGNSSNYYSGSNHPSSRDYCDRDYYDLKQSYYDKRDK